MSTEVKPNYQTVRAGLIVRGFTLKSWAEQRGYPISTVYGAARGLRGGIKAVKIRRELLQEIAHAS